MPPYSLLLQHMHDMHTKRYPQISLHSVPKITFYKCGITTGTGGIFSVDPSTLLRCTLRLSTATPGHLSRTLCHGCITTSLLPLSRTSNGSNSSRPVAEYAQLRFPAFKEQPWCRSRNILTALHYHATVRRLMQILWGSNKIKEINIDVWKNTLQPKILAKYSLAITTDQYPHNSRQVSRDFAYLKAPGSFLQKRTFFSRGAHAYFEKKITKRNNAHLH